MAATVLLVGAFDTKGPEYAFLRERILADGIDVFTLNTGVLGSTESVSGGHRCCEQVATAGRNLSFQQLRENKGPRGINAGDG